MDLLRWWRFLDAVGVGWDRATRTEARDFSCWIQLTVKQRLQTTRPRAARSSRAPGAPNSVTGKPAPGRVCAVDRGAQRNGVASLLRFSPGLRDRADAEPVSARSVPPVAARRTRITTRWTGGCGSGRGVTGRRCRSGFRGRSPTSGSTCCSPRWGPTGTERWSRSGSRPGPRVGTAGDAPVRHEPGQQLITVVRKGTRAVQQVPASADAFVWLRLYQQELRGESPGRTQPVWWTLRRPRPLTYHGAHRMFERVNATLGADWTCMTCGTVRRPGWPMTAAQPQRCAMGHGPRASDHHRSTSRPTGTR